MDNNQKQFVNVQVAIAQDAISQLLEKSVLLHFDDILPTAKELVGSLNSAESLIQD